MFSLPRPELQGISTPVASFKVGLEAQRYDLFGDGASIAAGFHNSRSNPDFVKKRPEVMQFKAGNGNLGQRRCPTSDDGAS